MSILVFDFETTSLYFPNYPHNHPRQGRIIQLAAALYDEKFKEVASFCNLISIPHESVEMSPYAFETHGISFEFAAKYGIPIEAALMNLGLLINMSEVQVAHNIKFEMNILATEEQFFEGLLPKIYLPNRVCTMWGMTPIMKLTQANSNKPKWPKLTEAYEYCYKEPPAKSHDAFWDVRTTMHVYKWIVENNHITKALEVVEPEITSQ